jgi:hypothetical protein
MKLVSAFTFVFFSVGGMYNMYEQSQAWFQQICTCECWAPTPAAAPLGPRNTMGTAILPPDMYNIFAAELTTWSMAWSPLPTVNPLVPRHPKTGHSQWCFANTVPSGQLRL